jgi:predicted ester cyclase
VRVMSWVREDTSMAVETHAETLEANKAVMRRYIEELWNQRKWEVIDEIIDPSYKSEPPSFPSFWGIDDLKKNCPPFMAMFPDGNWTTLDMVAEGDKVACAWEFNATHTKEGIGDGDLHARQRKDRLPP